MSSIVGFCDICGAPVLPVHRHVIYEGEDPLDPTIKHRGCEERDVERWEVPDASA